MSVFKWSRLEEEVEVGSLTVGPASASSWITVRRVVVAVALLALLLFLAVSTAGQRSSSWRLEGRLNSSLEAAARLRAEVQEAGERVNRALGQVEVLGSRVEGMSTAQPWREGLEALEGKVEAGVARLDERATGLATNLTGVVGEVGALGNRITNLTTSLEEKDQQLEDIKTGMKMLSNSTQQVNVNVATYTSHIRHNHE